MEEIKTTQELLDIALGEIRELLDKYPRQEYKSTPTGTGPFFHLAEKGLLWGNIPYDDIPELDLEYMCPREASPFGCYPTYGIVPDDYPEDYRRTYPYEAKYAYCQFCGTYHSVGTFKCQQCGASMDPREA